MERMSELQALNEFIIQNSNTERTINCIPEGISFARFADICGFSGVLEDVRKSIQSPVSVLRSVSPNDKDAIESATNKIVTVLVAQAGHFRTVEQFVWLTRITMAAKLLTRLPCKEPNLIKRLSSALEVIELASYNYSPAVIHLVTKGLIEDIPLHGVNLLHVIKMLGITNSRILYYVAVSLVFTGLGAITNTGKSEYRLHSVEELLSYLDVLNMEHLHQQRHNLQIIFQLLKLVGLYQNLVIMRHLGKLDTELESEHKCYASYFAVSEQQRKAFQLWLEKTSALIHLFGNDRDVDYLILADLIEVDMLPLINDVNNSDELL